MLGDPQKEIHVLLSFWHDNTKRRQLFPQAKQRTTAEPKLLASAPILLRCEEVTAWPPHKLWCSTVAAWPRLFAKPFDPIIRMGHRALVCGSGCCKKVPEISNIFLCYMNNIPLSLLPEGQNSVLFLPATQPGVNQEIGNIYKILLSIFQEKFSLWTVIGQGPTSPRVPCSASICCWLSSGTRADQNRLQK